MPDLASLQAAFAAALTARDSATADVRVLQGAPARSRRRLGFYRGNVQTSAYKALRSAYPVCERLVGESFFEGLAYAYAAAHPSTSGDLNAYGETLCAFIRGFAPAASLPYLADVAMLEWRVHRAHYAADRPPLDLRELSRLAPERFGELRAVLHPACSLVVTASPAASIWLAHQPGSDGRFAVDIEAGAERALVHRPAWRVEIAVLAAAPYAFLVACESGATLTVAVQEAQAHDAAFALDAHLAGWVRERVVTGLRLP
jgi:hypothetical protein